MSSRRDLDSIRRATARSVRFFSAKNKPYRERWVVRSFLTNLGVRFAAPEVRSESNDPPDVRFRKACFEIKEILDSGRRRHAEYKTEAKRAAAATHVRELFEHDTPVDATLSHLVGLVDTQARKLARKYSASVKSNLDLLFYVNLLGVWGVEHDTLRALDGLIETGFRSVSFLEGYHSYVVFAASSSPQLLQANVGRLALRQAGGGGAS